MLDLPQGDITAQHRDHPDAGVSCFFNFALRHGATSWHQSETAFAIFWPGQQPDDPPIKQPWRGKLPKMDELGMLPFDGDAAKVLTSTKGYGHCRLAIEHLDGLLTTLAHLWVQQGHPGFSVKDDVIDGMVLNHYSSLPVNFIPEVNRRRDAINRPT